MFGSLAPLCRCGCVRYWGIKPGIGHACQAYPAGHPGRRFWSRRSTIGSRTPAIAVFALFALRGYTCTNDLPGSLQAGIAEVENG